MSLPAIKELFKKIEKSIFSIEAVYQYPELAPKFIELASMLDEYDGDTEDWIYIGDMGCECNLASLLVGAFWHYTEWHSGQDSESYAALCAIGKVYSPGMECPPKDEDTEDDEDYDSERQCYILLNKQANDPDGVRKENELRLKQLNDNVDLT
jgi:hypothetical protein